MSRLGGADGARRRRRSRRAPALADRRRVLTRRRVEVERAVLDELQARRRGQRLRGREDRAHRVGGHRLSTAESAFAGRPLVDVVLAVGDHRHHPRHPRRRRGHPTEHAVERRSQLRHEVLLDRPQQKLRARRMLGKQRARNPARAVRVSDPRASPRSRGNNDPAARSRSGRAWASKRGGRPLGPARLLGLPDGALRDASRHARVGRLTFAAGAAGALVGSGPQFRRRGSEGVSAGGRAWVSRVPGEPPRSFGEGCCGV